MISKGYLLEFTSPPPLTGGRKGYACSSRPSPEGGARGGVTRSSAQEGRNKDDRTGRSLVQVVLLPRAKEKQLLAADTESETVECRLPSTSAFSYGKSEGHSAFFTKGHVGGDSRSGLFYNQGTYFIKPLHCLGNKK